MNRSERKVSAYIERWRIRWVFFPPSSRILRISTFTGHLLCVYVLIFERLYVTKVFHIRDVLMGKWLPPPLLYIKYMCMFFITYFWLFAFFCIAIALYIQCVQLLSQVVCTVTCRRCNYFNIYMRVVFFGYHHYRIICTRWTCTYDSKTIVCPLCHTLRGSLHQHSLVKAALHFIYFVTFFIEVWEHTTVLSCKPFIYFHYIYLVAWWLPTIAPHTWDIEG